MVNLGSMYGKGQGVGKDYAEAVKWYSKAAEKGDAVGMFNLGNYYAQGRGVALPRTKLRPSDGTARPRRKDMPAP